jgi:uncharacterized RDD family membrane protein YckC
MSEIPEHAKFQDRFFASLIDSIIIGGLVIAVDHLNIVIMKSFSIYFLFIMISILYKPYFESRYNATLGKMALRLKVTDWDYNYISFEKGLLRSLILIIPYIIYIPVYYLAFNNEYILDSSGSFEFSEKMIEAYPTTMMLAGFLSYLSLADVIVYLVDLSKKQRSWKDFIAKTYVIKKRD